MRRLGVPLLIALVFAFESCGDNIHVTEQRLGPSVIYGAPPALSEALTLDEAFSLGPWPDDRWAVADPTSRTGLRLRAFRQPALLPGTGFPDWEPRDLESELARLDGFSVSAPILVPFDRPLDEDTLTPATVYLFDIDESSPEFGQAIPLDLGRGAFPWVDRAAPAPTGAAGGAQPGSKYRNRMLSAAATSDHWEPAANMLILRPLAPLRPATRYAVALTTGVKDTEQRVLQSPWDAPHAPGDEFAVQPIATWLAARSAALAFTWYFTTQSGESPGAPLAEIRAGLDGDNALAPQLRDRLQPLAVSAMGPLFRWNAGPLADAGNPALVPSPLVAQLANTVSEWTGGARAGALPSVDYVVFGSFASPDVYDFTGGALPRAATAETAWRSVPFMLFVPKPTAGRTAPFPLTTYLHAERRSRWQAVSFAEALAEQGVATLAFDAAGHGPELAGLMERARRDGTQAEAAHMIRTALALLGHEPASERGQRDGQGDDGSLHELAAAANADPLWRALASVGRAIDRDGEGSFESGDGYLDGQPGTVRDGALQTAVDAMVVLRLFRGMKPNKPAGPALAAPSEASDAQLQLYLRRGDFNTDGVLDVGGPDVAYTALGHALGGMHAALWAEHDPAVVAVATTASGGSWLDWIARSSAERVAYDLIGEALGLRVQGCALPGDTLPTELSGQLPDGGIPAGWSTVALAFDADAQLCSTPSALHYAAATANLPLVGVPPHGRVQLEYAGSESGTVLATVSAADEGSFSLQARCQRGEPLALRVTDNTDTTVQYVPFEARRSGRGLALQSPQLLRWLVAWQTVMDAADPLTKARNLFSEPIWTRRTGVLQLVATGDRVMPVSASLFWARAAGLLGSTPQAAWDVTSEFVERGALLATEPWWDVDGRLNAGDALGPLPGWGDETSLSAIRFFASGDHDWVTASPGKAGAFDWGELARRQAAHYLRDEGAKIDDNPALGAQGPAH